MRAELQRKMEAFYASAESAESAEEDKKPAKRGRGRPAKKKNS